MRVNLAVSSGLVARLLAAGREGATARRFAVMRLLLLRDLGALSSLEERDLATLLWSEEGRGPDTLPRDINIFPWALLHFPEPEPGMAERAFRHTYLRGRDKSVPLGEVLRNVGIALWQSRLRGMRLVLSAEDVLTIEELIAEWACHPIRPAASFATLQSRDEAQAVDGLSRILTEHEFGADRLEGVWTRAIDLEKARTAAERPFALYPGLLRAFPCQRRLKSRQTAIARQNILLVQMFVAGDVKCS